MAFGSFAIVRFRLAAVAAFLMFFFAAVRCLVVAITKKRVTCAAWLLAMRFCNVGARLHWKQKPDEHDYAAAEAYLALMLPRAKITKVVARLRQAPTTRHKPKDLERASGMKLLPPDDPEVKSKPRKSSARKPLSPVLLVRGSLATGRHLVIADGYHRICASYHVDRDAEIPCRIVRL